MKQNLRKRMIWFVMIILVAIIGVAAAEVLITLGRTQVQVNIHMNKELIYLSTFGEPPQFAIWLESPQTGECQTVYVTNRTATGDWEGKPDVPVSLPQWVELFKAKGNDKPMIEKGDGSFMAVTGATPKDDYFSIRAEVKPGSEWICWVEMNLAGDFNDAFPEQDIEKKVSDEFSNGQPALLYKSEIVAGTGREFEFRLAGQSVWENGIAAVEPVSEGITSARNVFDRMNIEIIRPKPKLIDKNKIIQKLKFRS